MALIDVAEGLVATIVSESQVAVNIGAEKGVRDGDLVILTRSVDVTDPETNEHLGTVFVPKLQLRVTMVAERYSVARVTDRAAASRGTSFSSRPFKVITDDSYTDFNDPIKVHVAVGEKARVRRDEDEPPF